MTLSFVYSTPPRLLKWRNFLKLVFCIWFPLEHFNNGNRQDRSGRYISRFRARAKRRRRNASFLTSTNRKFFKLAKSLTINLNSPLKLWSGWFMHVSFELSRLAAPFSIRRPRQSVNFQDYNFVRVRTAARNRKTAWPNWIKVAKKNGF